MRTEICNDPAASLDEDVDFDKFMDEILITELKKKGGQEEDLSNNRVRKLIAENIEKPQNRIRFGKR